MRLRDFLPVFLWGLFFWPGTGISQVSLEDRIDGLQPIHRVQSEDVGPMKALGYDIGYSGVDALDADRVLKPGDPVRFGVFWQLTERVKDDYFGMVRMGGVIESALIRDGDGRPTSEWHIGEVNKQVLDFVVKLSYSQNFPPFFFQDVERPVAIGFSGQGISGLHPAETQVGVIRIASEVPIGSGAMCLSGNADIVSTRQKDMVRRILFPDGEPAKGPSATNVYEELVDGIYTGSGNSNWESVYWGSGAWGADSRRIVFEMDREVVIEGVAVASESPYQNFRIDQMTVELSSDGETYTRAGEYDNRHRFGDRGLHLLGVSGLNQPAAFVRVTLSHDNSATTLPVSEIFLFGYPYP